MEFASPLTIQNQTKSSTLKSNFKDLRKSNSIMINFRTSFDLNYSTTYGSAYNVRKEGTEKGLEKIKYPLKTPNFKLGLNGAFTEGIFLI